MMCSDTMSDSHILDKQESGAGMGGREGISLILTGLITADEGDNLSWRWISGYCYDGMILYTVDYLMSNLVIEYITPRPTEYSY